MEARIITSFVKQINAFKSSGTFCTPRLFGLVKEMQEAKIEKRNLFPRRMILLSATKQLWVLPTLAPVKMPAGLSHIDSDLCWCEPIVDLDENGEGVVIHREVTWN